MKERRTVQMHFRVSETEAERIRIKMKDAGIGSIGAYLRKMALDGYCIRLELREVKELVSLLRRCSNNLNQYAKRANESGSIYEEDILDVRERLDAIWEEMKKILVRLSVLN